MEETSVIEERMTITEVAEKVGVTAKTIIRWEKAGRIRKPKRDWKGWRIYLEEDLEALQQIVSTVYES
ncbi:MAG: MerR family transcriptional regulator [Candidatus Omnitrophica bacterium]|nr:MerR family transcriptional regulator [Candidatus Omnitrophota bacterium]